MLINEDVLPSKGSSKSSGRLITALAKGDLKALPAFYDHFSKPLYSEALKILGNPSCAGNVVHDVFLSLWKNAGRFFGDGDVALSWALLSIRSRCAERLRMRAAGPKMSASAEPCEGGCSQDADVRARIILESTAEAFFALDEDWRFTQVNPQSTVILGRPASDLIGKRLWEEYAGLAGSVFEPIYRGVAEKRVAASVTSYYPDHKRWYDVHAYPANRGISVYFRDVSEQKRVELALADASRRLHAGLEGAHTTRSLVGTQL